MKYWSQLEVEKIFEILYERQAAHIKPEMRKKSCILAETEELLLRFKEKSANDVIQEIGVSGIEIKEQCDGNCSHCQTKNE